MYLLKFGKQEWPHTLISSSSMLVAPLAPPFSLALAASTFPKIHMAFILVGYEAWKCAKAVPYSASTTPSHTSMSSKGVSLLKHLGLSIWELIT